MWRGNCISPIRMASPLDQYRVSPPPPLEKGILAKVSHLACVPCPLRLSCLLGLPGGAPLISPPPQSTGRAPPFPGSLP